MDFQLNIFAKRVDRRAVADGEYRTLGADQHVRRSTVAA
jgi:hypothetical protein